MDMTLADPKGLVRESYAIEGITLGECRSIFLDWALSLRAGTDEREAVRVLISHYAPGAPGHPMNEVLTAALAPADRPVRRGGRAGRVPASAADKPR
ncbi:MAG: hypothetical protein KDE08_00485 [Rhodobacteraceae bacterium]|nr:hypothetical protein [Paracoccaceae bacterium]